MVNEKLLSGVLAIGSIVLVLALPAYCQKNKDNPNMIGHRTVAHRSIISPEKEREIGMQYATQFESGVELVQDPVVDRYVATVAEKVVRNSDWKGPFTVKVVMSPEVNSFSLPGGLIYVNSGLLLAVENEDEIAGAIAHHVAHIAARHWASMMTKMTFLQYSSLPLLSTPMSFPVYIGVSQPFNFGVPLAFLKFRREAELEADYLGLQYMYKAGYDPKAYVVLLGRFAPCDVASHSLPNAFAFVPPVSERITQAEEEIRKILHNAPSPHKSTP